MMTALIVIASSLAYLAGWLLTARSRYARTRLLSEPLNCQWPALHSNGTHDSMCRRQSPESLTDSDAEAAAIAMMLGLIWPLIGPAMLLMWAVQSGHRATLVELEARNARLERELGMGRPR